MKPEDIKVGHTYRVTDGRTLTVSAIYGPEECRTVEFKWTNGVLSRYWGISVMAERAAEDITEAQ